MSNQNSTLAEIVNILRDAKSITVCSHYGPDPDAYGSSCGLSLALRSTGREVLCVNEDGAVARLLPIPGVSEVVKDFSPGFSDVLVACDCGDRKRIGDRLGKESEKFPVVINIDHHASNDYFGTLNYVIPTASSTSEIILALIEAMEISLTKPVATALFYGISGDTGSFRYSSTTASTFDAARRLVEAGATPHEISQSLYNRVSLGAMKLHSEAISSMLMLADGKIAEALVTEEMVRRLGAEMDDAEDLKHITQTIAGVEISVIIREFGDLWRVSLRSRDPKRSVAIVAESFGGGGHHAAAAFRWRGTLDVLRQQLHPKLLALVNQ